ncbi:MAG: two-component regulator propeller domain-containing protein [Candidatus Cloacimonetes bacterium]|nr:two-component regulator propeller domain-containing protein [Candidatus Cloacimonadota bacterium]
MRSFSAVLSIALACCFVLLNAQLRDFAGEAVTCTATVNCAAEDENYLYLGTGGGLIRQHKITNLRDLYHIANSTLPSNSINTLAFDNEYTLWIGTDGGISSWDANGWQDYQHEMPMKLVSDICVDDNGMVYICGIVNNINSLVCYDGNDWIVYNESNSVYPDVSVVDIAPIPGGGVWTLSYNFHSWEGPGGTGGYVLFNYLSSLIDGDMVVLDLTQELQGDLSGYHIVEFEPVSDGSFWFFSHYYYSSAVSKYHDGQLLTHFTSVDIFGVPANQWSIKLDGDENLWVSSSSVLASIPADLGPATVYTMSGLETYGRYILLSNDEHTLISAAESAHEYSNTNGYICFNGNEFTEHSTMITPVNYTWIFEAYTVDNVGNLWIALEGSQGLFKRDSSGWTHYDMSNSPLSSNYINCLYADPSGGIWVGTIGHLAYNDNEVWSVYDCEDMGLWKPKQIVRNSHDTLYVMDNSGIFAFDISEESGEVYLSTENSTLPSNWIRDIAVDADNNLWVATLSGLVRARGNDIALFTVENTAFTTHDFRALCVDGDEIWMATYEGEVAKYDGQFEIQDFTGFWNTPQQVMDMAIDNEHQLWITRQYGPLYRYTEGDLVRTDTPGFALTNSYYSLIMAANDGSKWIYVYPGCIVSLDGDIVSNEDPQVPPHSGIQLSNYPNPFNPSTTITFSVPKDGLVRIDIYNIKGQKVKELNNSEMLRGHHDIIWDGKDADQQNVCSGIYFVKLQSSGAVSTRKIMLMK